MKIFLKILCFAIATAFSIWMGHSFSGKFGKVDGAMSGIYYKKLPKEIENRISTLYLEFDDPKLRNNKLAEVHTYSYDFGFKVFWTGSPSRASFPRFNYTESDDHFFIRPDEIIEIRTGNETERQNAEKALNRVLGKSTARYEAMTQGNRMLQDWMKLLGAKKKSSIWWRVSGHKVKHENQPDDEPARIHYGMPLQLNSQ